MLWYADALGFSMENTLIAYAEFLFSGVDQEDEDYDRKLEQAARDMAQWSLDNRGKSDEHKRAYKDALVVAAKAYKGTSKQLSFQWAARTVKILHIMETMRNHAREHWREYKRNPTTFIYWKNWFRRGAVRDFIYKKMKWLLGKEPDNLGEIVDGYMNVLEEMLTHVTGVPIAAADYNHWGWKMFGANGAFDVGRLGERTDLERASRMIGYCVLNIGNCMKRVTGCLIDYPDIEDCTAMKDRFYVQHHFGDEMHDVQSQDFSVEEDAPEENDEEFFTPAEKGKDDSEEESEEEFFTPEAYTGDAGEGDGDAGEGE